MIPETETIIHWGANHQYLMLLILLIWSIGASMFFLGNLYALVYAFGQNIWWSVGILLILLLSFVYCLRHWDCAAYAGKLIIGGFLIAGIPYLLFVTVLLYRFG